METTIKFAAFIKLLNDALASAFPVGMKFKDMGDFHGHVQETIEPLLFGDVVHGTWSLRIKDIYPDGQAGEKDFMKLDTTDCLNHDKRHKFNGPAKVLKAPVYTSSIVADTLEDAIHFHQQDHRKVGLKRTLEFAREKRKELDQANADMENIQNEIMAADRELASRKTKRLHDRAKSIIEKIATRLELEYDECHEEMRTTADLYSSYHAVIENADDFQCLKDYFSDIYDIPANYNPHA